MNFISLCSGIEAASVAFGPLGWKAIAFSEIEPFPSAVLAYHYPTVRNYGDMSLFREWPEEVFAFADAVVGGPPCQAFSVAGARRGLADARGNLTLIYVELLNHADAIRKKYGKPPVVALYENVPGIFSDKTNAFGCLVGGLAGEDIPAIPPGKRWTDAGCVFGPERAVAWRLLDAQFFALAQRRRRVFVVASARKGFDPAQVLFEWDGLRRDSAPSREARQTAPTIPSRSTAGGGLGTDFDCDGGVVQVCPTLRAGGNRTGGDRPPGTDVDTADSLVPVLSQCITTGTGQRYDPETETIFPVTHSLRGEGFDASEGGTGRGTPLVPHVVGALACNTGPNGHDAGNFACNQAVDAGHVLPVGVTIHGTDPTVQKVASYSEVAQCLRARTPGNIDNSSTTVVQQPVSYGIRTANTSSNGWGIQEECTHTLDCAQGVAVAFTTEQTPKFNHECALTLTKQSPTGGGQFQSVMHAMQVRRLTPTEAEKLQGFEPGYTAIPWRKKPASECPDGPRYKALGNSWAVPNVRWIGERIARQINSSTTSPHPAGFFTTTP